MALWRYAMAQHHIPFDVIGPRAVGTSRVICFPPFFSNEMVEFWNNKRGRWQRGN